MYFPSVAVPMLLALSCTCVAHESSPRFLRLRNEEASKLALKATATLSDLSDQPEIADGQKKEDDSYWARLMQETDMSVAPTQSPPTPSAPTPGPPTPPPTPPPTSSPVPAPTPGGSTPEPTASPVEPAPTEAPPTGEPPTALPTTLSPTPQITPPPSSPPTFSPTPVPDSPTSSPTPVPDSPTPGPPTDVPTPATTASPVEPAPTEAPMTPDPTSGPVPPTPEPTTTPPVTPAPTPAAQTPPPTASPTTPPATPEPTVTPPVTPAPTPVAQTPPPTASPTTPPSTPEPTTIPPSTPAPTPGAQTMPPTASPIPPPPTNPVPTAPTSEPTPFPTSGGDACALNLLVECFSSESESCETAFPATLLCEGGTTSVSMKYIGGECDQSANMQISQCMDLQRDGSGPDTTSPVFIEVNDLNANIIFSGTVEVGEVYRMTAPGAVLSSVATIRIFTDSTMESPLQRVSFSPSCTDTTNAPLSVNDIFGASQVVGWTNSAQGVVDITVPQTLTFNYTIANTGSVDADMQALVTTFTEGEFSFNQAVNFTDLVLTPGEVLPPLPITVNGVMLDSGRRTFVIDSEVTALNPAGVECSDQDTSEFSFGYDMP